MSLPRKNSAEGWRDGGVGKALAARERRPEFEFLNPHKAGAVLCVCRAGSPMAEMGGQETGESLEAWSPARYMGEQQTPSQTRQKMRNDT